MCFLNCSTECIYRIGHLFAEHGDCCFSHIRNGIQHDDIVNQFAYHHSFVTSRMVVLHNVPDVPTVESLLCSTIVLAIHVGNPLKGSNGPGLHCTFFAEIQDFKCWTLFLHWTLHMIEGLNCWINLGDTLPYTNPTSRSLSHREPASDWLLVPKRPRSSTLSSSLRLRHRHGDAEVGWRWWGELSKLPL